MHDTRKVWSPIFKAVSFAFLLSGFISGLTLPMPLPRPCSPIKNKLTKLIVDIET